MALRAFARLSLRPTADGGLLRPLPAPTPTLIFRTIEGDGLGEGLVGLIQAADTGEVCPGEVLETAVVFPEAESRPLVTPGRRFALWDGVVVGEAEILDVPPDDQAAENGR
jgi:hypothetical protein